jgi:hypothetical protein
MDWTGQTEPEQRLRWSLQMVTRTEMGLKPRPRFQLQVAIDSDIMSTMGKLDWESGIRCNEIFDHLYRELSNVRNSRVPNFTLVNQSDIAP